MGNAGLNFFSKFKNDTNLELKHLGWAPSRNVNWQLLLILVWPAVKKSEQLHVHLEVKTQFWTLNAIFSNIFRNWSEFSFRLVFVIVRAVAWQSIRSFKTIWDSGSKRGTGTAQDLSGCEKTPKLYCLLWSFSIQWKKGWIIVNSWLFKNG